METRHLPAPNDGKGRVESGPVQFGDDWTGVFLRGDHCAYYALCLDQLSEQVDKMEDIVAALAIRNLLEMFSSSNEFAK